MNQKIPSSEIAAIVPMLSLPLDVIQYYWQTLYMEGLLDYRLCDVENPTWDDVKDMMRRMGRTMFAAVNIENKILGEFMLENFTGAAAQIHFSVRPGQTYTSSLSLGRIVTDEVLQSWGIKTLYGLTPATNRAARIYNLKVGFKCIGILPNGIKDRGKIVDGHIMVKEA